MYEEFLTATLRKLKELPLKIKNTLPAVEKVQ